MANKQVQVEGSVGGKNKHNESPSNKNNLVLKETKIVPSRKKAMSPFGGEMM